MGITSILPKNVLKFPISFIDIIDDLVLVFGLEFNEVERYIRTWIKLQNNEFNLNDYFSREISAASHVVYEQERKQLLRDEVCGQILRDL